jgi:HEAT repeat protein
MAKCESLGNQHDLFRKVAVQFAILFFLALSMPSLSEIKDRRAIPLLAPLLNDEKTNYKVAWALEEIGGASAIQDLIGALDQPSSDVRVIAIQSLAKLNAKEALPRLRRLLDDREKSRLGSLVSVAEAQTTITAIETKPSRRFHRAAIEHRICYLKQHYKA